MFMLTNVSLHVINDNRFFHANLFDEFYLTCLSKSSQKKNFESEKLFERDMENLCRW